MNSNILTTTLKTLSEKLNIDIDSLIELSNCLSSPCLPIPNKDESISNQLSSNLFENQNNNDLEKAARIIDIIGYLANEDLCHFKPNEINEEATCEEANSQILKNNYDESLIYYQAQQKDEINQRYTELDSKQNTDIEEIAANSNHLSQRDKDKTSHKDIFTVHQDNSMNWRNREISNSSILLNKKRLFKVYYHDKDSSNIKIENENDTKKHIIHKKLVFSNKQLKYNIEEIKKEMLKNKCFNDTIKQGTANSAEIPCSFNEKKQIDKLNRKQYTRNSKYRGVSRNGHRWQVLIMVARKKRYVGTYFTEDEAEKAYDTAAIQNHGLKAKTNFSYTLDEIKQMLFLPPILKLKYDLFTKHQNCFIN